MDSEREPVRLSVDWRRRHYREGASAALENPGSIQAMAAGCDCHCHMDLESMELSMNVNPACRLHGAMPKNVHHFN